MTDHRLVFVGGLHRSGTTPLTRCLAAHSQISGFEGTGVEEDEGQHLQTVYPPARAHGGRSTPPQAGGRSAGGLTGPSSGPVASARGPPGSAG